MYLLYDSSLLRAGELDSSEPDLRPDSDKPTSAGGDADKFSVPGRASVID